MAASFFFYDLETSGLKAQQARIMQFAGQRTDEALNPIGEPANVLIKLTPDVLPDPEAILMTGITPQMTLQDGLTEVEFLRFFEEQICRPDTTFLGFNSVRFDDNFMRHLFYRNFYDAYRWQWCDNCSRWDMMDVVRMTRALRPEGIQWPYASDGSPSNRLELLTSANRLDHEHAHDALSDVYATIAVARLVKTTQPKLFAYLLDIRHKQKVKLLVESGSPFVYTSGSYPSDNLMTTIVSMVAPSENCQGAFVFDLRYDPNDLAKLSVTEMAERWQWPPGRKADSSGIPVKTLRYNRCPAVAPINVLDKAASERLHIDISTVKAHAEQLKALPELGQKLIEAERIVSSAGPQASLFGNEYEVDGQLYDGLIDDRDKQVMEKVRSADNAELAGLDLVFHDSRLNALLPLYKARNYPAFLTKEEREAWDAYRRQKLISGGHGSLLWRYFARLETLAKMPSNSIGSRQYIIEELRLYGEAVAPIEELE